MTAAASQLMMGVVEEFSSGLCQREPNQNQITPGWQSVKFNFREQESSVSLLKSKNPADGFFLVHPVYKA